ncbi:MAG: hypothetical protein IJS32_07300 [Kiritimatiellae bacterium]|nr:hypothetical protein [Kiritimatiellia bacterium]
MPQGFFHLSQAMDMFARDIAGWAAQDTPGTEGPPAAPGKEPTEPVPVENGPTP